MPIRQNVALIVMATTQDDVLKALRQVTYPGFTRDIVSFGIINGIELSGQHAVVNLKIRTADPAVPAKLKADVEAVLKGLPDLATADVRLAVTKPETAATKTPGQQSPARQPIPGVKHVIAIASGKGGVGKSTFSVNLACALERELRGKGHVGLLDCDLYGPSVPLMMGVNQQPELRGEKLLPVVNFGVKIMSIGLLVDEDAPIVWRGPLITKAIRQFAEDVEWGETEVMVVDLPPGTGDTQLSMAQILPLDGVVVVTTPQRAAADVARRGARMFEKVEVPLLGVAENMAYFEAPDGSRQTLFGEGGGARTAQLLNTRFLGQVPLDTAIREGGDHGIPLMTAAGDSNAARAFSDIARNLMSLLKLSAAG